MFVDIILKEANCYCATLRCPAKLLILSESELPPKIKRNHERTVGEAYSISSVALDYGYDFIWLMADIESENDYNNRFDSGMPYSSRNYFRPFQGIFNAIYPQLTIL